VALPCLLFLNIMQNGLAEAFDAPLILLCVAGSVVCVALLSLITPVFIKDAYRRGAFIQVCFHSNSVLLGLPFIYNLAGTPGLNKAATVLAFTIPLLNALSVLVLADDQQPGGNARLLLKRIIRNPLIIAAFAGVICSFLPLQLPLLLERPLSYISDMAMPLALFTIGGTIRLKGEAEKLRLALAASGVKLIAIPLIAVLIACRLGFDTVQMAVTLAIFAAPPAVSCFPVAFQMGADHNLTSLAIVLGTGLSALTMFAFVLALRLLGWV
jgi:predicted permease